MQEGIHPEYGPAVFYDRSADKYFLTKSTFLPYAVTCRGEPPFYEATASDLAKLAKADIVVPNGAGYDGWAEKAQLDKKRQTIVNVGGLMGVTATDEHEHSHDHAEGEEGRHHHHGATNPHLWFSPEAVLKAAEAINAVYADKAGAGSATAATVQRHFNDRKKPSRKWTTGPRITRHP